MAGHTQYFHRQVEHQKKSEAGSLFVGVRVEVNLLGALLANVRRLVDMLDQGSFDPSDIPCFLCGLNC
jgi:hypothetical protein